MPFPNSISERESYILQRVLQGKYEADWNPIDSVEGDHSARFWVMTDALKVDGVRVCVSAELEQKIADAIGASLLTPKLADLLHAQAEILIEPLPRSITATTQVMLEQDAAITRAIAAVTSSPKGAIVSTVGKHWCLDRQLATNPDKAVNYGWHFKGTNYKGIRGLPTASGLPKGVSVIQPSSTAHNMKHVDYCLAPETRVLTADLRWVPVGAVRIGEELVGFDETLQNYCKLRGTLVQATTLLEAYSYEIVTSRGSVTASGVHRWPVHGGPPTKDRKSRYPTYRKMGWVTTQDLQPGMLIPYLCSPWEGQRAHGIGVLDVVDMTAEVLEVRPLGNRTVVGVQTSTNTLVAEGLLSHNSQVCVLVLKSCIVDGQLASLADVLTSSVLAPLASHCGPLTVLRQPGVPEPTDISTVLPEIGITPGTLPNS